MRLLLLWMATKYGCDLSSSSIQTDVPDAVSSAERFLLSFEIYPFVETIALDNHSELVSEANAFLDAAFHPSIELAGSLHEHLTSYELELVEEKSKPSKAPSRERKNFIAHIRTSVDGKYGRRKKGQFYTPPWVVDYCLEKSLGPDLMDLMKRLQQPKDIPFTVLDPACGTGNFLLGIIRNLRTSGATAREIYTVACESIHGRDIDGRSVAIAIWSIVFTAWEAAGDEVEKLDFSFLIEQLRAHLRMTDSVFDSFGAKDQNENRFDLVITNPPYISFGSRNQERLLESTSLFLRHHFPNSAEYKIRLNSIFQEVALNYVVDGGKICLFIPNSFLTGQGYAKLRASLLKRTRILSLSEFPEDAMKGAVVGRWCVAIYQRDDAGDGDLRYPIDLVRISNSNSSNTESSTSSPVQIQQLKNSWSSKVLLTDYKIMASRLVTNDQSRFRLVFEKLDEDLAVKLESLAPLSTVARGHTGIRAREGQKTIVAETQKTALYKRGIKSGGMITPFVAGWDGTWLKIDPVLLFGGGFDPKVIENPKILMRQTADRIIAAYDDSGLYHLNNVHSFSCQRSKSQHGIDLHLLLGLMNSTLWHYLYRLKTREDGRALAQIDIETVETMPLPICEARLTERIAELSRDLSTTRDVSSNEVVSRDNDDEIRNQIDQLVYQAYGLTPREIEHVERCLGVGYNSALLRTSAL